jgi:hypothetical protein
MPSDQLTPPLAMPPEGTVTIEAVVIQGLPLLRIDCWRCETYAKREQDPTVQSQIGPFLKVITVTGLISATTAHACPKAVRDGR